MIRFTEIIAGRYSRFEPTFAHFLITAIVFGVAYFVAMEYNSYRLHWAMILLLVPALFISSIGLVVGFGSIRYPKMIMLQGLVIAYLAAQIPHEFFMKAVFAVVTVLLVYLVASKLCLRFLKLRNIWETCTGIIAFSVLYPYTVNAIARLL